MFLPQRGVGQIKLEATASGKDDGPFDDVLQFADISGPVVILQSHDLGRRQGGFWDAQALGCEA